MYIFIQLFAVFILCFNPSTLAQTPAFTSNFNTTADVEKFRLDKIQKNAWQLTNQENILEHNVLKIMIDKGFKQANNTERSELQDPHKIPFDEETWYRVDFQIPKSFPKVDVRLAVWQIKQSGNNNPLIAMYYINGKLRLKQSFDNNQINYYQPKKANFNGKWMRVIVHARVSHSESGFVNVYLDNNKIIEYKGQTAHHNKWEHSSYFKFGLYRDVINMPMHMFYKQYSRGTIIQDVLSEKKHSTFLTTLWKKKVKK